MKYDGGVTGFCLLALLWRPPTPTPEASAAELMSVRVLQANVDRAFLWHFLHANGRDVSPAPNRIRSIGVKIIRATGGAFSENYHFYVFNSTAVNAMTSPGGNIFLFKGILELGLNDAETAALIAHEVGHVVNHHWLARLERGLEARQRAAYAAKVYGPGSAQLQYLYSVLQNLSYDRREEYQADFTGMQLMVDAGYPASAMVELLRKTYDHEQALAAADPAGAALNSRPRSAYLSNHPLMPERIQKDAEFAASPELKPRKKRLF